MEDGREGGKGTEDGFIPLPLAPSLSVSLASKLELSYFYRYVFISTQVDGFFWGAP